jgi:hypothetical protein
MKKMTGYQPIHKETEGAIVPPNVKSSVKVPEVKEAQAKIENALSFGLPNGFQLDKDVRAYNVGESDYAQHKIQPWDIWIEYKLNPFDADIIKRVLRHKKTDSRKMDYEKIIHICQERIRQLETGINPWGD